MLTNTRYWIMTLEKGHGSWPFMGIAAIQRGDSEDGGPQRHWDQKPIATDYCLYTICTSSTVWANSNLFAKPTLPRKRWSLANRRKMVVHVEWAAVREIWYLTPRERAVRGQDELWNSSEFLMWAIPLCYNNVVVFLLPSKNTTYDINS